MIVIDLDLSKNLAGALTKMLSWLGQAALKQESFALKSIIVEPGLDYAKFLGSVSGLRRAYFKSRDSDFFIAGLGSADDIIEPMANQCLSLLQHKSAALLPEQFYIGGLRFDEEAEIAPEWHDFGRAWFFLPLLQLSHRDGQTSLLLNFCADGHLSCSAWRDHALSLLNSLLFNTLREPEETQILLEQEQPDHKSYVLKITQALSALSRGEGKKVVLSRRRCLKLDKAIATFDPLILFLRLEQRTKQAFWFFLDSGKGACFFGASPELLFRREDKNLATEALAGTCLLGEADNLLKSPKDQFEQALVAAHIEQVLAQLGADNLERSNLSLMSLEFVQHLVQQYQCQIDKNLSNKEIFARLHPTPAVCGWPREWAKNYIRSHDNFDRGFYSGAIACLGRDYSELTVAIRSALCYEKKLYIYAGSGIVPGSIPEQEWDELTNKQKTIMSIFYK